MKLKHDNTINRSNDKHINHDSNVKYGGELIDEYNSSVPDFIYDIERFSNTVTRYGGDPTEPKSDSGKHIETGAVYIKHRENTAHKNLNKNIHSLNNAHEQVIPDLENPDNPHHDRTWYKYETWEELAKDPIAVDDYYNHINYWRRMKNPIAWSSLYEPFNEIERNPAYKDAMVFKNLCESDKERFKDVSVKEYLGIGVILHDGSISILSSKGSETTMHSEKDSDVCASLDNDTLQRLIKKPGSFIFHTHPQDPACEGIMSPLDLIIHTTLIANEKYLYGVVISKYGVLIQGLEYKLLQDLYNAKSFNRSLTNFIFDLISSHNARKSWKPHTMKEYFDFFDKFRVKMLYVSSDNLALEMNFITYPDINYEGDLELVTDCLQDVHDRL